MTATNSKITLMINIYKKLCDVNILDGSLYDCINNLIYNVKFTGSFEIGNVMSNVVNLKKEFIDEQKITKFRNTLNPNDFNNTFNAYFQLIQQDVSNYQSNRNNATASDMFKKKQS